jgi:hypothetical protein
MSMSELRAAAKIPWLEKKGNRSTLEITLKPPGGRYLRDQGRKNVCKAIIPVEPLGDPNPAAPHPLFAGASPPPPWVQ